MNKTITLAQFIEDNAITMDCERTSENPFYEGDSYTMNHYRCTLKIGTQRMTVFFSMGLGLAGEPDLASVLDCLASDASEWENSKGDFEEWANEYGYDPDSRRAERIYRNVEMQSRKLESFLGEELYKQLIWETERM
jgi:hypothetical protein